ncbi:hypothetical protein BDR26DRAFT_872525 [Obelidium mucronatum]|nr:hypothetical protein BDR26DRAFT_872525 [Obelidium mucronatum]
MRSASPKCQTATGKNPSPSPVEDDEIIELNKTTEIKLDEPSAVPAHSTNMPSCPPEIPVLINNFAFPGKPQESMPTSNPTLHVPQYQHTSSIPLFNAWNHSIFPPPLQFGPQTIHHGIHKSEPSMPSTSMQEQMRISQVQQQPAFQHQMASSARPHTMPNSQHLETHPRPPQNERIQPISQPIQRTLESDATVSKESPQPNNQVFGSRILPVDTPQKESTMLKTTASLFSIDAQHPDGKLECAIGTIALKSVGNRPGTGRIVMYDDESDEKVLNIFLKTGLKIITCDESTIRLCVSHHDIDDDEDKVPKETRKEATVTVYIIRAKSHAIAHDFVSKVRLVI